ncbi:putative transposable element [Trichonephila clavipes]|nr:putative transposable element [Trichonephila clavipes]
MKHHQLTATTHTLAIRNISFVRLSTNSLVGEYCSGIFLIQFQHPDKCDHFCLVVMLSGNEPERHGFCPPDSRHFIGIVEKGTDEAHFWLNGYVNKQNCHIWSETNPQVDVETPLHPEKLTVWYDLWAGGILLQKR